MPPPSDGRQTLSTILAHRCRREGASTPSGILGIVIYRRPQPALESTAVRQSAGPTISTGFGPGKRSSPGLTNRGLPKSQGSGTPTPGSAFPVAEAAPPKVGAVPRLRDWSVCESADTPVWDRVGELGIRRLAAALEAFPQGIPGPERPPPGRGHGVHMPTLPDAARGMPRRGVAPATAASSGSALPLRRPWCNRKTASDIRSAVVHIEMTFRCTCTPLSDVHVLIGAHSGISALKIRLQKVDCRPTGTSYRSRLPLARNSAHCSMRTRRRSNRIRAARPRSPAP